MKNLLKKWIPDCLRPVSVQTFSDYAAEQERKVFCLRSAVYSLAGQPIDSTTPLKPFNRQEARRKIFDAIIARLPVSAIVETGAFLGETTAYMARKANRPVFSVEVDWAICAATRRRLQNFSSISVSEGDSRAFLESLASAGRAGTLPFFYLDAHWYRSLPLLGELKLIGKEWAQAVIMVDDFQVDDDPGYCFDDYGKWGVLSRSYIRPVVEEFSLACFYPAAPSSMETGGRRGCIVLAVGSVTNAELEQIPELRRV